jgi:uncharacterized protein YecT (DUF1311 family)
MLRFTLFASLLLFAFTGLADDKLREARASFQKADTALNKVWAEIKAKMGPAEFKAAQEDQRGWVAYRDYIATGIGTVPRDTDEAKVRETPEYLEMAAGLMESRVPYLRALLKDPGPDDSITGEWSDSRGGRLEIVQQDGKLYFALGVVRGPTFHVGDIAGVARWNEPLGFYSDERKDSDNEAKDDETWIFFRHENRLLKIDGANTQHYHGARAHFDGEYRRVGKLTEKQAAKLVEASKKRGFPEEEKPEGK